jgi:predicted Zn-dependent protease
MSRRSPESGGGLHTPRSGPHRMLPALRRAAAFVIACCAAASSVGCVSDQKIREVASKTNEEIQLTFVSEETAYSKSFEIQNYVDGMAKQVLAAARAMRPTIEVDKEGQPLPEADRAKNDWIYDAFNATVIIDPQANAFVVGDDTVYVHSSLLLDIECPEQLMACLCHEFGHIVLRHGKNNIESGQFNGVLNVTGGILSNFVPGAGLVVGGAQILNGITTFANNKEEEHEADEYGVRLFASMGYDPQHMARFFEVLREKYGDGGILSTHPSNTARAERVREVASSGGAEIAVAGKPFAMLDPAQFAGIREQVRAEQDAFEGVPVLTHAHLRARAFSCFDYCHHKQEPDKGASAK